MINKFIQELDSIPTQDLDLSADLPIALETSFDNFQTYKVTFEQLKEVIKLLPEEFLGYIEQDPQYTNILYEIQNDKLVMNYDETTLNELLALVETIRQAITNLDTGDLYNLHNEITNINQTLIDIATQLQDFIDNFSGFDTQVITFPTLKNPALGYQNTNNFNNFEPIYNYTISKFQNKIIVYILLKDQADINFQSQINFYNFQDIFQTIKQDATIEVEFIIKCGNELMSLWVFLSRKVIKFFPSTTNNRPLLTITTDNLPSSISLQQRIFNFKANFDKNGFIGFSCSDTTNVASQLDVNNSLLQVLTEASVNTNFNVGVDGNDVFFINNDVAHAQSLIVLPDTAFPNVQVIHVNLGVSSQLLPLYTVEFNLQSYRIASPQIQVSLTLLDSTLGEIEKTITIPNNRKDNQVIVSVDYLSDNISYFYTFSSDNLESVVDFEIDYTKFSNANDLTLTVQEHSKNLILNIQLKQPFILDEGLLPDYFKPNIIPQQSEDLIAVFINSAVGSLDILENITINLITGDTKGFFKYFAYALLPVATPVNFDSNLSTVFFPIVSLGGHTEVTEVSNIMSSTSTYNLEMKQKNDKKYLFLLSSADNDNIYFEKQRKKQFQTMLQSFASKMLNTTLYFQTTISSNRSGLNLNFFNPNPEYNGSDVSVYVPIRETEYVFNGYLRLDILNDQYQNIQGLTDYYFIKAELHFVDYYCINNVINKRISNDATYNFDEKQSRTILIFVKNLTDATKDFFFNLDLVFGLRQREDCDFWIRVVNRDVPVKLIDQNPSLQVLPNLSYGVQYSSSDTNFVYERKFTINRTVTTAPLDVKTQKFTFAVRLSSDRAKCQEIPYNPMVFITANQLASYPTLAEVQALIVDIVAGGTIDLTEYATLANLQATQDQINNYVLANFATKNELQTTNTNLNTTNTNLTTLSTNLQNNYYNKTDSDNKFALKTSLDTTNTNLNTTNTNLTNLSTNLQNNYYNKTDSDNKFALKTDVDTTNTNLNTTNTNLANLTTNLQDNYYNKTDIDSKFDDIDGQITTINQSISSIDTQITADKIMSVIENTPNSTIFAFAEDNKLYFQSNELDYNIQYVDADFTTLNYTFETFTTCITSAATTPASNYMKDVIPETSYVYMLRDNFDVLFYDVKFGAFRAVEYWALKDGTTDTFTQQYKYSFACNLNGEDLSEDFISVKFLKCIAQCASPSFNDTVFGTTTTPVFNTNGASTNARATVKYPTTCFRIKLNNFPIIAFPLTTSRVVSSVTAVDLDNFSFYTNNSSFLFCNRTEIDKMYNFITQDNIINWHEASNQTFTFDEDILEGQIYNLYLTNNNPESQTVANTVNIKIARKTLKAPKSFTLRLICNVGLQGKTVNLVDAEQGVTAFPILTNFPTTYFTYTTASNKPIEFVDISCIYKKVPTFPVGGPPTYMLSMTAPKILKDITYYDWAYKQGVADKASLMRASTSLNPLTTTQYAQFNANRPIIINQTINGGETLILQNLKMYYLRGQYSYYSTASLSTPVYTTSQYKDNCVINITINNPETPSLVILDKIAFQNVIPIGNNKMFPLSTSSTTNYTYISYTQNLKEPLQLRINGTGIFSLTNTNSYKDYIFSWKRTIVSYQSQLLCVASPATDIENATIETSTHDLLFTPSLNTLIIASLTFATTLKNITVTMPSFVAKPQFNTTFKTRVRFAIYDENRFFVRNLRFKVQNNRGFETSTYITYTSPYEFRTDERFENTYLEYELTFTANGLTSGQEKWIVNITQAIKSW